MEERIALIVAVLAIIALSIFGTGVYPMSLTASGAELKDVATYWMHTGTRIGVAWDPVTGADAYVYRVRNLERGTLIKIDGQEEHTTTETQFFFVVPFAGHFVAEVKAVAGSDESTWAVSESDDNARVNDRPRGWWIYGHIAPPGGGIEINSNIRDSEP